MLNLSPERRAKFIIQKKEEMQRRILTGKQQKASPEEKERLRAEALEERFKFEESRMGGYELIFPSKDEA